MKSKFTAINNPNELYRPTLIRKILNVNERLTRRVVGRDCSVPRRCLRRLRRLPRVPGLIRRRLRLLLFEAYNGSHAATAVLALSSHRVSFLGVRALAPLRQHGAHPGALDVAVQVAFERQILQF
jgi:hypothetical protein